MIKGPQGSSGGFQTSIKSKMFHPIISNFKYSPNHLVQMSLYSLDLFWRFFKASYTQCQVWGLLLTHWPLEGVAMIFRIFNIKTLYTESWLEHSLMMASSNGNIFRVTGPFCGNSTVTGEFPSKGPETRSFDGFLSVPWINDWVNNCDAGDMRRHRAH